MMIEKNGVNQVLEKHEETRSDDYWKKIIEVVLRQEKGLIKQINFKF